MKNTGERLLQELMENRTEHVLELIERLSSEKLKIIINKVNKLLNKKD